MTARSFERETLLRLRVRFPFRGYFVVKKGQDPKTQAKSSVPNTLDDEPGIYVVTALKPGNTEIGDIVGIGCSGKIRTDGSLRIQGLKTRILKGKKQKVGRWDESGEFGGELAKRGVIGLKVWWHVTIQRSSLEEIVRSVQSEKLTKVKCDLIERKLESLPRIAEVGLLKRYLVHYGRLPTMNREL